MRARDFRKAPGKRRSASGGWYAWAVPASELAPESEEAIAARDRITEIYPERDADRTDLASLIEDSPDILAEMLKERFERLVDFHLDRTVGTDAERQRMLDALFVLHDEGLLTKAEVRRRAKIEPEDYYDEFRASRLRRSSL